MIIVTLILSLAALFFLPKQYSLTFNKDRCSLFKAFLPFLIILGHISLNSGHILADFNWVGMFAVGLFFFISGYGLETKRECGKIILNELPMRIVKLVLPLIAPIIIYGISLYATHTNVTVTIVQNIKAFGIVLPFTWFVVILCGLYAVFYITAKCVHSATTFAIVVTLVSLAFSFGIAKTSGIAYLSLSNLTFPAGIIFKQQEDAARRLMNHNILIICMIVSLTALTWYCKQLHNYLIPVEILVWTIAVVLIFSRIPFKPGKVTRFLSKISYEVYLCQGIAFVIFGQYPKNGNLIMHILFVMTTTIIMATICHKVCPTIKINPHKQY